ncbi:MAG: preprotein translocase subunit SecG [Candidatus Magnetomorum sp.]|nr:preprotein translocase subunit SecG [Candidatus Magnetomorum sp.]
MSVIITIIHVFVAIALIMIVLLQTGKGADMGIAFGGGSSQTLFGTTGASTFLSKSTTVIAVIFMLTTFSLTYMWGNRNESSIMTEYQPPAQTEAQGTEQPVQEDTAPTEMATQQATAENQPAESVEKAVQPIQQDAVLPNPAETEAQ